MSWEDREDGTALVAEVHEHGDQGLLGGDVHAAEGFVQQQDVGALGKGAGHEDPLTLSAGQRRYQRVAAVQHSHLVQGVLGSGLVRFPGAAEPADAAGSSLHDHVPGTHGETPVDALVLGNVGYQVAGLADGAAMDEDAAGGGGEQGDYHVEEVLLPAPLGPTTPMRQPGPAAKETLSRMRFPSRSTVRASAVNEGGDGATVMG